MESTLDARVAGYLEQARALTAAGRFDDAIGFEQAAGEAADRLGSPSYERIAILEQVADRLGRQGDRTGADDHLREALQLHRRLRTTGRAVFDLRLRRALLAQASGRHGVALVEADGAIEHARRHLGNGFAPVVQARRVRAACLRRLDREAEALEEEAAADETEARLNEAIYGTQRATSWRPEAMPTKPPDDRSPPERLEDVLAELDGLIGLAPVKEQVRTYVNFLRIQRARTRAGHRTPDRTYHLSFEGPPGTGKTTVARLFGRILHALGALERGHLVETSRAELVAGYVGQTAARVNEIVDRALDGVLFVDEAYAMVPEEGGRDFGDEAVSQLLIRMENDRARLAVILAGYPEPMNRFLASNPGLASRIAERIPFPHYSPAELAAIFRRFLAASDYDLTPEADKRLTEIAKALHADRDESFGNARTMRNLFDDAIGAHADRLVAAGVESGLQLCLLEPADLEAAFDEARAG